MIFNVAKPFRRQMKVFNVSVHIIEPGFFKTNITDADTSVKVYRNMYDRCPQEVKEEYGDQFVSESK